MQSWVQDHTNERKGSNVVVHEFGVCLFENVFLSSSNLKDSFDAHKSLVWPVVFLSFCSFSMSPH